MPLLILPNAYGDAVTNMAVDASLLSKLPAGIAVFRHYGWMEPAITFGYTQKWSEVEALFEGDLRLCRRLTGGGIVDHRNDWTYALAIQASLSAAHSQANHLYLQIHKSLASALLEQEIQTQLAPCQRDCSQAASTTPQRVSQCFVQPAANDVLSADGNKIAGAAMKRTREGILIQGSVDRTALPTRLDFTALTKAFTEHLAAALEIPKGHSDDIRSLFDGQRIQEERSRFASEAWLKKR